MDDKISGIYHMLFPYGEYNYDRAFACTAINRELKNLCRANMRHVLLIVGRYLGHKFTPETSTNKICETIQNEIYNLCLIEGTELDKAKFVIGTKTGIVNPMTQKEIICRHFRLFGEKTILEFINSLGYPFRSGAWHALIRFMKDKDDPNVYISMLYYSGGHTYASMLKEGKVSETFNLGLKESGEFTLKDNKRRIYFRNQDDLDFINNIIDRMSTGELKYDATWDDVCK